MIEVKGVDLDLEAMCQLRDIGMQANGYQETIKIRPIWVSTTLLLCETPAHEPKNFSFELSFADGAYVTETGATFTYDNDAHLLSLTPAHVTLRAYEVGVLVNATGLHLRNTPGLTVEVAGPVGANNSKGWRQPATWIDETLAIFAPPPVLEAGAYRVWISNNGVDFALAASDIFLTYHADFIIRSTSLTRVQNSSADQVGIELRGEGLPTADMSTGVDFYCIFGPYWNRTTSSYDVEFERVILRANLTTTDGSAVRCENIPTTFAEVPASRARYNVTLSLSYDLQELLWN